MANETHKITINGKVASIVLGDVYDNGGDYNIGSVMGIEKLGEEESLPPGTFPIDKRSGTGYLIQTAFFEHVKGIVITIYNKRSNIIY